MKMDIPKPQKTSGAILISIACAVFVVLPGACGTTVVQLSDAFEAGDSGIGFAFWMLVFAQYILLIPTAIAFGALMGYLSLKLATRFGWKKPLLLTALGGVFTGVVLVTLASFGLNLLSNMPI
jgi:hypothetical protein